MRRQFWDSSWCPLNSVIEVVCLIWGPLNTGFAVVIVIGDRSRSALLVRLLQHGTFATPGVGYSTARPVRVISTHSVFHVRSVLTCMWAENKRQLLNRNRLSSLAL